MVLQIMTDRRIDIGRCNGVEMNEEKNQGDENLKKTEYGL